MSIGDKEVYPLASNDNLNYNMGLTYREWLIGMLASNPATLIENTSRGFAHSNSDDNAKYIILQADAIIKQLDEVK